MSSIVRLDEHDLILVRRVQWFLVIFHDGEMESSNPSFHLGEEFGVLAIVRSNQISTSETILIVSSRAEDRAVVDRNRDNLLVRNITSVTPKGGCESVLSKESCVLYKSSVSGILYIKPTKITNMGGVL